MAIRWKHDDSCSMYFCTFTCYKWLPLFETIKGYDLVYKWFDYLKTVGHYSTVYVIMPNHLHVILYFPEAGFNLNKIISNAKRFMAYEIIKRLEEMKNHELLEFLVSEVTEREKKKGQLHKVFTDSFDAKGIYNERYFNQKFNYIHRNPVSGKWHLVNDFTEYEHSGASYYEISKVKNYVPFDFRLL